jgi:hypothetical protein
MIEHARRSGVRAVGARPARPCIQDDEARLIGRVERRHVGDGGVVARALHDLSLSKTREPDQASTSLQTRETRSETARRRVGVAAHPARRRTRLVGDSTPAVHIAVQRRVLRVRLVAEHLVDVDLGPIGRAGAWPLPVPAVILRTEPKRTPCALSDRDAAPGLEVPLTKHVVRDVVAQVD